MKISSALRRYDPTSAARARLQLRVELGAEEEHPRELLRDGAAADRVAAIRRHIGDDGADHADRIDAGMPVEAAILDGQHRLLHPLRNRRERHAPPLLARAGDQPGQHRRIERDFVDRLAGGLDPLDAIRRAASATRRATA